MNKEKAIQDLGEILDTSTPLKDKDYKPAIKLGIEALKRCKTLAENSPLWAAKPLPGETKE